MTDETQPILPYYTFEDPPTSGKTVWLLYVSSTLATRVVECKWTTMDISIFKRELLFKQLFRSRASAEAAAETLNTYAIGISNEEPSDA